MAVNDDEVIEQQRLRRKRIDRIKTGIIMTIAIWMLASLIAIIILSVQVVLLSGRMEALEQKLEQGYVGGLQLR